MEARSSTMVAAVKLLEVIVNGDSPPSKRTVDGVEQTYPPTTAEEKLARKNALKARGTLLMALSNEHQLKFNTFKCAKTLMEAIEKRFGGNKESKKTQKTLIKQQYENFNGSSSERLDQTYDKLQKLISQVEILGETISQEDMNLKFLRSLPSEWKTHTLIWRNKPDLDTLSMDDLYNNLKIYETEVKGSNHAFGSNSANTDSMSVAVIYSFFANQSNSLQLNDKDLQQIDVDDLEDIDLKWQMAMLTMRARRFLNKTGRKINANGFETIGFNKSKVECYNCHKKGHFARECRAPRENRNREPVKRNVTVETTETKALVAQDRLGYDWSNQAEEGPTNFALMAYTSSGSSSSSSLDSEVLIKQLKDNALTELRNKFEKSEKERDDLKLTLQKFGNSSKNLSNLLEIQVSDKFKTGVGFDSQVVNSHVFDSKENERYKASEGYLAIPPPYNGNFMPPKYDLVLANEGEYVFSESISDSEDENETEFKSKQRKPSFANTEFVKSNEHMKIPRESVKKVENKKKAKYPRKNNQSPRGNQRNWNNSMTQKLGSNFEFKNKACYECGSFNHLIKDCEFYEKKMVEKIVWNNAKRANHQNYQRMTHPHPKGNFVPKAVLMKSGIKTLNTAGKNFSKAVVSVNTARLINTAYPRLTVNSIRTSSNVFNREHSHVRRPFNKSITNKNNSLNEKVNNVKGNITTAGPKGVVSDNKGNITTAGPKAVVSDNKRNEANAVKASACWGNPQLELLEKGVIDSKCSRHMTGNKSYLSDYEELMVELLPLEEIPKENIVPLGGPREPVRRNVTVETTETKALVAQDDLGMTGVTMPKEGPTNFALMAYTSSGSSSSSSSDSKNEVVFEEDIKILKLDIKLRDNALTELRKKFEKAEKERDDLKLTLEKFGNSSKNPKLKHYIIQDNPQLELHEKGVIDSGCSRHMTGNKSYLSDYEEIDGGFVAFGGDPKGGRITGKGKISTDTECVVLSPDFMLLDENHVLLRVPRKDNMHNVDLRNIVPSRGRKPALSLMRLFGCPVTILNTLDHLGKFDGKADEGLFVGYSTNSKAYMVFNSRARIVEENLHVKFSEETSYIVGNGPNWLFDIDALTISMNYKQVVTRNQTNGNAGTKENIDAGLDGKKIDSPDVGFKPSGEEEKIDSEHQENEDSEVPNTEEPRINQEQDANVNSANNINTVSPTIIATDIENNVVDENCNTLKSG
ncbi:ribonuclease H-like domain-containing protein [Tanacetum coccineum]